MPLVSFKNLGAKGIITDMAPNELPLDAWSRGNNVRFTPLGVERTLGNSNVYGTPLTEPLQAFRTAISTTPVWSYWGATKAYSSDGTTQYDITRAVGGDYTVNPQRKWTGGNFNGIVVANNGADVPQAWIPSTYSTKATDMANWPATLRCNVLRPFNSFLLAMDLTISGVSKPTALRWSHPADPGSVPPSWDITDTTKDAGEWYLNETPGRLVDAISHRNDAILYKSDSIYRMQYVGGAYIFRFSKVASTFGMPTARCCIEVVPGVHIFWTGDDIVRYDGQNFISVIDSKCRRQIQNISDTMFESSFMVHHPTKSEVWLCWPTQENTPTKATTALVFNWITGAWGVRDLGAGFNFITTGPVDSSASGLVDAWQADTEDWDSDTTYWGDSQQSQSTPRLLGGTQNALTYEDTGFLFNGSSFESYVERTAFGIPFDQNLPPDISTWKFCREIWPRVTGDAGTVLGVTIGSMDTISDAITWGDEQNFVVGTDVKVNCTCSGRMFAIKFRSSGIGRWTLHGFDLEVNRAGGY